MHFEQELKEGFGHQRAAWSEVQILILSTEISLQLMPDMVADVQQQTYETCVVAASSCFFRSAPLAGNFDRQVSAAKCVLEACTNRGICWSCFLACASMLPFGRENV